jgi:hypothetical protein
MEPEKGEIVFQKGYKVNDIRAYKQNRRQQGTV